MENTSVIVSGATSQVGYFLLPRLAKAGFRVHALSREARLPHYAIHPLITWHQTDISDGWKDPVIQSVPHYIHLAPLWLLPDILDTLFHEGVRRIVALGSTSVFTKADSPNPQEHEVARKLAEAEETLIAKCNKHLISWTLFRPTMIYGCGMDKNVTMISKFIKRFGFFPIVGDGRGYRQPVHADDIAYACEKVMNTPATFNRDYNLTGGQLIQFRGMVEAIFLALGTRPRIVTIPRGIMVALIKIAAHIRGFNQINKEMIERVNHDICFDSSEARRDFGYCPRPFHCQDWV
jgi:nucleoside-diphosphate-sugar epimerase